MPGACGAQRGGAPALAAEAPEHPDAHGPPSMNAFLTPNDHTERQGPRGTVPRPALQGRRQRKRSFTEVGARGAATIVGPGSLLARAVGAMAAFWRPAVERGNGGSDAPRVVVEGAVGIPWNVAHVCATWG